MLLALGQRLRQPAGQRRPHRFDAPSRSPTRRRSASSRRRAARRPAPAATRASTCSTSVDAALASRLALIDGAQRTLDLQYYAIHADASTEVMLQRVRDAARRGVRVRILLDDFNAVGEDAQVLRLAFEPNVEMRLFNPLPGSRRTWSGASSPRCTTSGRMQKRMHNKLFIADNAWGIAGGRNLGDAYFGTGDKQNFVDLDVLAAGRIVRDMSASFDRFWNDELAYPVQTLLDQKDLDAPAQARRRRLGAAAAGRRRQPRRRRSCRCTLRRPCCPTSRATTRSQAERAADRPAHACR